MNYTQEENNEKQMKMLAKFRENLENISNDSYSDAYLLRWIKAADFDLVKAREMFHINLRARELVGLNLATENYGPYKLMEELEFTTFLGFDKENYPIVYITFTNADFKGILSTFSMFDIIMRCAYWTENLQKFQEENDTKMQKKREHYFTTIFDYYKFPWQQCMNKIVIESGLDLLRLFQELVPGVLNRVIIINAPIYFTMVFDLFKPILKSDILERIIVCNKESSPNTLLKFIDLEVLPEFLGGTRVDENGDPFCSAFVRPGKFVPEDKYLYHQLKLNISDPNVSQMIVSARSYQSVQINVDKPNSKLIIEFWTDGTISFQMFYEPFLNELDTSKVNSKMQTVTKETLIPYFKVHSHIAPVNHTLFCCRSGVYFIHFDNSFSWFSSKQIVYRTTVIPPSV